MLLESPWSVKKMPCLSATSNFPHLTKCELVFYSYMGEDMSRNWIVGLFIICVLLGTTCGVLYQELQEEKLTSALWEVAYNLSESNCEYYQQLYNDCLNGDNYRWDK